MQLLALSGEVSMEAEARQEKPPGADTSHPDREYRATGKKAVGGGRQAVAWHQAQQWKLRLQNFWRNSSVSLPNNDVLKRTSKKQCSTVKQTG